MNKKNSIGMPKIRVQSTVKTGVSDIVLSKPNKINAGNPSAFPLKTDPFKNLSYQSASQSEVSTELKEYYNILSKVMGGTATSADLNRLTIITENIKDFVLTDEDYNLIVGALQNLQAYVLKFMYTDIGNKAGAMDGEMNKVINDVNRFITELENIYSQSPSNYPIPNNSILKPKLASDVVETLDYADSVQGVVVGTVKPTVEEKSKIWFNTGGPI